MMPSLAWFGHVVRHDSLSKAILQDTFEGGRRRGRQRKCWMDNIKEWTSLPVPELLTRASCRKDWKRISAKSSPPPLSLSILSRSSFLLVLIDQNIYFFNVLTHSERGPRSANSTSVVLENTVKLKPVSKQVSCRRRERTLSLPIALWPDYSK